MSERTLLVGRWEPSIVTTLRRYIRRGAPPSLLLRIAGGPRCWRELNLFWNLDGRGLRKVAPTLTEPSDAMHALSAGERRIALVQLADEYAEAQAAMPVVKVLAGFFGVSRYTIADDLELLRRDGKIAWHLTSDGRTGARRVPELA